MMQSKFYRQLQMILKVVPWWKIPISLGVMLSTVEFINFWDVPINWTAFVLIFLITIISLITANLLQMRLYIFSSDEKSITFLNVPSGKPKEINKNEKDAVSVNLVIYFLFFLLVAVYMSFLFLNKKNQWDLNFVFLLMIISILIFSFAGNSPRINWSEELLDGLLTVFFPSVLVILGHQNYPFQKYILSYLIPDFCFFLAFRFILGMSMLDYQVSFKPGFFVNYLQKRKFRLHHLFYFLAYFSLILMNRLGVSWELLAPQLLLLPSVSFQIVLIEKIMKGSPVNWKLLGWLSYLNLILLLYFQCITIGFYGF